MPIKPRQDAILVILKKQGFATVKDLCDTLHYSPATIYRDLEALSALRLVKRSYGGAELVKRPRMPALPLRYDFMKKEKRHLGRAAASLVENGDTVFIDGTTTTESMGPFLTEKKDLCVITNNLRLALYLGEYDIKVVCIGGEITERPSMLGGAVTVLNARRFFADKAFFSTGLITPDGVIGATGEFSALHTVMIENSKKCYYLADHSKLTDTAPYSGITLAEVTGVICDFSFPQKTQRTYPDTEFLIVED